jgi:hypothetical protein
VPKSVCTRETGEADPRDRPQEIGLELFLLSMLHYTVHKEARSSNRPCVNCKEAQVNKKTSRPIPAIGQILLHHIHCLFAVSTWWMKGS